MIPRPNRRSGEYVNCFTCGNKIYVPKCKLEAYERHYCSKKCRDVSPYKKAIASERMRINNPTKSRGVREKISEKSREYFKTHKIYNYIDGSSRNRKYCLKEWIGLAKECYKRDNYTCQKCAKNGGILNAHHILAWTGNPELAFDLDNLITLCVACHTKVHGKTLKEKIPEIKKGQMSLMIYSKIR